MKNRKLSAFLKNRSFNLVIYILILMAFVSCVSMSDKTNYINEAEKYEISGKVQITFTIWQPLHILSEQKKRNIQKKAYYMLLEEAQYKCGVNSIVDVINIEIKSSYSGNNFWFIGVALGGGYTNDPYVAALLSLPMGSAFLLSNIQKVTATGDAIIINYQDKNNINRSNFTEEKIKNSSKQSQKINQSGESNSVPQLSKPNLLQQALNQMPEIPIAGKRLKFEFGGDNWIAKIDGRNFLAGDCIVEKNGNGYILTLKTTNVWSGAVEEAIDLFQKAGVPLGPAATPLRTAAKLASKLAKWIPLKGSSVILEYNEGPPASLLYSNK